MSTTFEKAQQFIAEEEKSSTQSNTVSETTPTVAEIIAMGAQAREHFNMGAPVTSGNESEMITSPNELKLHGESQIKIQRSSGSSVSNVNPKANENGHIVLNEYSKQYYKLDNLLSRIERTKTYDKNFVMTNVFTQEYVVTFSEGMAANQDVAQNDFVRQEMTLLDQLKNGILNSISKSLDISLYDSVNVFERDLQATAENIIKEFAMAKEYNILLSKKYSEDGNIEINKTGLKRFDTQSIMPLLGQSEDGLNIVTLPNVDGYQESLFKLGDYNIISNRLMKTRFRAELKMENINNPTKTGVDLSEMLQILNIVDGFSSSKHVMLGNGNGRRSEGQFGLNGSKPIFVATSKLRKLIERQTRFSGETNSNEFSNNYTRILERIDGGAIFEMTEISRETYNDGDILGFLIYPKSYLGVNILSNQQLLLQYNKLARQFGNQKDGQLMILEYFQNMDNTREEGFLKLKHQYRGMSLLPNPFSMIALTYKPL